jgi:hypothetical protein
MGLGDQLCAAAIQQTEALKWVIRDQSARSCLPLDVRFQPKAGYILRGSEMTRRANSRHCLITGLRLNGQE